MANTTTTYLRRGERKVNTGNKPVMEMTDGGTLQVAAPFDWIGRSVGRSVGLLIAIAAVFAAGPRAEAARRHARRHCARKSRGRGEN